MASKHILDALANRIRLEIEKSGFHSLFKEDLDELWNQSQDLSFEEKMMLLRNFAITYGYQVQLNANLSSARFYVSGELQ